jgi:hypothetical protein
MGVLMTREEVIAHLVAKPRNPMEALHYMGVPVDATWPAEALLVIAEQSALSARRQSEAHIESLSMMSALGNRR